MIRRARNIFTHGAIYGLLLTAMVLSMQHAGALQSLEHWCYDERIKHFQFFTPPPTDRIVHLDIDDAILDELGAWPWKRERLAEMIDVISAAGPRVIAMDVLFHDPQSLEWKPTPDGKGKSTDNDALFADAVRRAGCVVVGASLAFPNGDRADSRVRDILINDLEMNKNQVVEALIKSGVSQLGAEELVARNFLRERREAMYDRIRAALVAHPADLESLRSQLLRRGDRNERAVVVRVLEEEYQQVKADLALLRFSRPAPPGLPPMLEVNGELAPIPLLSNAAASAGFFDYPTEAGGVVRRVPLFAEYRGRVYPHISIAMAAMMYGSSLADISFSDNAVTIARRDLPPVVVPVYTIESQTLHRPVPMMFDIPYFGPSRWEAMYDKAGQTHFSLNAVWDICQTKRRIQQNNAQADSAMRLYLAVSQSDPEKAVRDFEARPLPPDDVESRRILLLKALDDYGAFFDDAINTPSEKITDPKARADNERLAAAGKAIHFVLKQMPLLRSQLDNDRITLRQRLGGRAVLIGWTATSAVADLVPTSLHDKAPGVVIHGTIFNAIMTGHFFRRAPEWVNTLLIVAAGFLTTLFASRLSPSRAFAYAALLGLGYTIFTGLILFDRLNVVANLAGPLVAIAVVWAGCTLARLLVESMERARITRRFSSYVDPSLVSYVADHPDEVRLEGQVRELTVVFTDLEGFTRLTEQLGEKTVAILNEFMGMAVPIIRQHKGLVNKFLGDGIMFFFGAPLELPDHAARAIATVLDLQSAMVRLNETFMARGFPPLGLRVGISTGHMVVGDAGSEDASDYTVLGSCVNLGARLESANKLVGSRCLITHRSIELAGDAFLIRPIGKLCVVGMQAGTMIHEALARQADATDQQRQLAKLSCEVVECFMAGKLDECTCAIERMESALGPSRFTTLYREQVEAARTRSKPGEVFDCQIVLTEK